MIPVSAKLLATFKRRSVKFLRTGACDPKIAPFITLMNSTPGIATTFCCEGHPEKMEPKQQAFETGYVLFVANAAAMPKVYEVYTRMFASVSRIPHSGKQMLLRFSIEACTMIYPSPNREGPLKVYPALSVTFPAQSVNRKEIMFSLLDKYWRLVFMDFES